MAVHVGIAEKASFATGSRNLALGLMSFINIALGVVDTASVTSRASAPCQIFSALPLNGSPSYDFTKFELVPRKALFGFEVDALVVAPLLLMFMDDKGMEDIEGSDINGRRHELAGDWPGAVAMLPVWPMLLSYDEPECCEDV